MKRRILFCCALCSCLLGAAFSGMKLYQELRPRMEVESQYRMLRETVFGTRNTTADGRETPPDFTQLDRLSKLDGDVKGWIRIPGTTIDYPVVQGADNAYYLNHSFDGGQSIVGSIFMDYENRPGLQDDVTVLYGHHIKGGRMFSPLSGYKKQSFYDAHPTGYWYEPDGSWEVEWFAGEILDGQTASFTHRFPNAEEKQAWLARIRQASVFASSVIPTSEDKILALCTCTYEYGDARLVIYGRLKQQTME